MIELNITGPRGEQSKVGLDGPEYFLGRDPACQIHLMDRKVSRKHARIFVRQGQYWIEDLGSANGVQINGRLIGGPTRLAPDMDIEVGVFRLRLAVIASASGPQVQLLGLNRGMEKRVFPLPLGEHSVGRIEGNAIVVPDRSISRFHAKLHVTPQGVLVEDLGSSNGCFVNRKRVSRAPVPPGAQLAFGSVEFQLLVAGAAPTQATQSLLGMLRAVDRQYLTALVVAVLAFFLLVLAAVVALTRPSRSTASGAQAAILARLEEEFAAKVRDAARLQAEAHWDQAIEAYQAVLERDPLNFEAAKGLTGCQEEQRQLAVLAQANNLLTVGDAQKAYDLLSAVPSESSYFQAAQKLLAQARLSLADRTLREAQAAFDGRDWLACHGLLVKHLGFDPGSTRGQGLLRDVERELSQRGIKFTSYQSQVASYASGAGALDAAALQQIAERYPTPALQAVVKLYLNDELEAAQTAITPHMSAPGADVLTSRMLAVRSSRSDGQGALVSGDIDRAITAWENALQADAGIVPGTIPNKIRNNLQRQLAGELYKQGEGLFKRALYRDAFERWTRGARYDPNNPGIIGGFQRLEPVAQSYFINGEGVKRSNPSAACDYYRQALEITRPESQWHTQASQQIKSLCK